MIFNGFVRHASFAKASMANRKAVFPSNSKPTKPTGLSFCVICTSGNVCSVYLHSRSPKSFTGEKKKDDGANNLPRSISIYTWQKISSRGCLTWSLRCYNASTVWVRKESAPASLHHICVFIHFCPMTFGATYVFGSTTKPLICIKTHVQSK